MITLPALTYQRVLIPDEDGVVYVVYPFDANGNLLSEMTFEVSNEFNRSANFLLPLISDLNNNYNIQIKFVANVMNGTFVVLTQGQDYVGQYRAVDFESRGRNNVFTPIADKVWSSAQTF